MQCLLNAYLLNKTLATRGGKLSSGPINFREDTATITPSEAVVDKAN